MITNEIYFFENQSSISTSDLLYNVNDGTLILQVDGNVSNLELLVLGNTDLVDDDFVTLKTINASDYNMSDKITSTGIYWIDINGIRKIKLNLSKITGSVNVKAITKRGLTTDLVARAMAANSAGGSYTLPIASAETLGGVKVGANLNIDENGVLSAGSSSKYSFTKINTEEANAMFKAWRQEILDTGVIPPITYNQGSSYMLYLTDVYVSGSLVNSVVFRFKGRSEATEYNGYRVFYLTVNFNVTTGEVSSYKNAYSTTEYEVIAYGGMSPNPKKALTTDNTDSYTPTKDYNPATKKYVDDTVSGALGDISTVLSTLTTVSEVTE